MHRFCGLLEWGGAAARTRDENFLRGAGAGWEFLSSVRDAGKGAKRAPKWSRNVHRCSETRKSEILSGVARIPSSEMLVRIRVCARFQDGFHQKTGFISKAFQRLKMRKKGPFSTFSQFLSRNASIFALERSLTFNPDGKLKNDQNSGRKRRTRRKKLQRFYFLTFSRTTGKTPSRFAKKSELNLDLVFLGWDEDRIFTFSDENDQNASRREISLPNRFWKSKKVPSEHQIRPFFTKHY